MPVHVGFSVENLVLIRGSSTYFGFSLSGPFHSFSSFTNAKNLSVWQNSNVRHTYYRQLILNLETIRPSETWLSNYHTTYCLNQKTGNTTSFFRAISLLFSFVSLTVIHMVLVYCKVQQPSLVQDCRLKVKRTHIDAIADHQRYRFSVNN